VAESYIVFIGALLPDDKSAAVIGPLLLALMMASGGFFVSPAATPLFFRILNRINLFRCGRHLDRRGERAQGVRGEQKGGGGEDALGGTGWGRGQTVIANSIPSPRDRIMPARQFLWLVEEPLHPSPVA
jgi:hypothetical protein